MKLKGNGTCVYCRRSANTRDHAPSKCLLEKPYPKNLLTVSSCDTCNKSFSLDEEYFLNVLVEISTSPVLLAKKEIEGAVYRARERSVKLKERIERSLVEGGDGRVYIQVEYDRLKRIIEKNALGIYFKRYGRLNNLVDFKCTGIYPADFLDHRPTEILLLTLNDSNFMPKRWTVIQEGVFSYIVVKDFRRYNRQYMMIFNIHNTIWAVIDIPTPANGGRRLKSSIGQLKLFS